MATMSSNQQDSEAFEKRPLNNNAEETASVGVSNEAPPQILSLKAEDIKAMKKKLNVELDPLLEKHVELVNEIEERRSKLDSQREELKKITDKHKKELAEQEIRRSSKVLESLTCLLEICEFSIAEVEGKYLPTIREWERLVDVAKYDKISKRLMAVAEILKSQQSSIAEVEDKYLPTISQWERLVGIAPKNVAKYDKISKRLKTVAQILESQELSKCFSSLCGNLRLLKEAGYQKSYNIFYPIESPLPEGAFECFCVILYHCLKRLRISSIDGEAKRSFLSMPFFVCALEEMDPQFHLDVEVSVTDECSQLDGKANIVIYCGNVEIVVIEERRSTPDQDPPESVIPLALVEMDCLAKKRLSVKRPDFQLNKDVSFGIVTDFVIWYFLKLDVDGTYSISECYDLPANIVGEKSKADLLLLRGICMRIRGLVEEAMKSPISD